MYISPNLKSKAAIKRAIADGRKLTVFQPNDMFGAVIPDNGTVTIEGPHYPEPHRFYGKATLKDGFVVKVQ